MGFRLTPMYDFLLVTNSNFGRICDTLRPRPRPRPQKNRSQAVSRPRPRSRGLQDWGQMVESSGVGTAEGASPSLFEEGGPVLFVRALSPISVVLHFT